MTLHIFADVDQRSDEWYAQRRGMVTASVVGQLLTPTLKPANNDTSRNLTALLVAERITGYVEPTFLSDDMFRGIEDEPRARDLYAEHFEPVTEVGFMRRSEKGWTLGFSPDGLVGDKGLIEVKSRRQKKQVQTILSGEVPVENFAQLQAGLLVSGRKWIDYVSYSSGLPLWVQRVRPDKRWFDAIIAAVKQFERTAEQMVAEYGALTAGLPVAERVDLELVI